MRLENGEFCPLVNGPCKKWDCKFWIQLRGVNPQTGEEIDDWNCTISYLPTIILEASQQARQAGAAVEEFRNESCARQKELSKQLMDAQEIIPTIVKTLNSERNNNLRLGGS